MKNATAIGAAAFLAGTIAGAQGVLLLSPAHTPAPRSTPSIVQVEHPTPAEVCRVRAHLALSQLASHMGALGEDPDDIAYYNASRTLSADCGAIFHVDADGSVWAE